MNELIELTKSENETVRLRAAQQMCPCRVQTDLPEFWQRIFELAEDPSEKVRYQVMHNMCDGSPEGYEAQVLEALEIFNRDPDKTIRRKAHQVLAAYKYKGEWNIM